MVVEEDVKSARHGMVHQVKMKAGGLGRDVNVKIPLTLTMTYHAVVREFKEKHRAER